MLHMIKKVTLQHLVVRQLLWPVFMEFFHQNCSGPQPYPIEGIGIVTLMARAWWVVVLAAAPMVNVSRKGPILTLRAPKCQLFFSIDSYVVST